MNKQIAKGFKQDTSGVKKMSKTNILWILLDQCRADVFSCYEHPFVKTPNIDYLAQKGVIFTNAFAQGMPCVPSRVSMLSGLYPHQTKVMSNPEVWDSDKDCMDPKDSNLLRFLKKNGFKTLYSIGKVHLGISPEKAGFTYHADIGPIRWLPDCQPPETYPTEIKAVRIPVPPLAILSAHEPLKPEETYCARGVDMAMQTYQVLNIKESNSFLLRLSLDQPHSPVSVPSPYYEMFKKVAGLPNFHEGELDNKPEIQRNLRLYRQFNTFTSEQIRLIRSSYFGMVAHIDAQIGRLLEYVKKDWLDSKLLIIFTADHGCYLGEHGLFVKGFGYTEAVRVPLIISQPGFLPEGKVVSSLVELVDLLPTLLDIYHLPVPDIFPGRSLLPLMNGQTNEGKEAVYSEDTCFSDLRRSIRTLKWHYSRYEKSKDEELYNLEKDPSEKVNLAERVEYVHTVRMLDNMINRWLESTPVHDNKYKY